MDSTIKIQYLVLLLGIFLLLVSQAGYTSLYTLICTSHSSVTSHEVLLTGTYGLLGLLQVVELSILLFCILKNRGQLKFKDMCRNVFCVNSPVKGRAALLILSLILMVAVCISTIGFSKTTDTAVSWIFESCKSLMLLFDSIMWIFVVGLAISTVSEWDAPVSEGETSPLLQSHRYDQLYHQKGEDTAGARKILQPWFVIHFFVYYLFMLATFHAITRVCFIGSKNSISNLDLATLLLYVPYDVLGCILPFILSKNMSSAHKRFHEKIQVHLIQSIQEISSLSHENPENACEVVQHNQDGNHNETTSERLMTPQKIEFCADYEFKPNICGITWPLETQSRGFCLSILIAASALVVSIITAAA